MSIVAEFEKLKARDFLFGLIGFLATLGPGFLLIYRYHPELVEKYDIWKLILFSAALTLPFSFACLIAFIVITARSDYEKEASPEASEAVVWAAFGSTFVLNLAVLVAYFDRLTFRHVMGGALIGNVAFILAGTVYAVVRKRPKANPPTNP